MPENQPQVPVMDPATAAPGAPASPPGSLAASVAPPGSAVPPVDPVVPQAPAPGAPAVDPSAPAAETPPAPETPTPEYIPRAVHEEQFRNLQSVNDKQVADLKKQLQAAQAQPAVPQGQPTPEEFSNETFYGHLDKDPKAAMVYFTDHARRDIMADVDSRQQAQQRGRDAELEYINSFNDAVTGFTPEERQRAQQEVARSFTEGSPVTPLEAAATGRFGSMAKTMDYAARHMATLQPDPNTQPAVPPVVPGTSPGQILTPQGAPSETGPGTYKSLFRD